MKLLKKVLVIVCLLAILLVAACGTPPRPITQDQLAQAQAETRAAEERAAELERQLASLKAEINARLELIEVLEEMVREKQ